MVNKILLLGGNGLLGAFVGKQLLEDGYRVRLLLRKEEKLSPVYENQDSVEVVRGDATNQDDLKNALSGCEGVHISLTYPAELIAVNHILTIDSPSLEKLSYISGSTVKKENTFNPIIRDKYKAEKRIRESGLNYQIFRPSIFIETISRFVVDGRATILGKQTSPYHLVSGKEFAKVVSQRLQQEESSEEYVFGQQEITLEQALNTYLQKNELAHLRITHLPHGLARLLSFLSGNRSLRETSDFFAYLERVGENYQLSATICKETVNEVSDSQKNVSTREKRILVVATNSSPILANNKPTGLLFSELTHFIEVVSAAGYEVDVASPAGGKIPLDVTRHDLQTQLNDPANAMFMQTPRLRESLESSMKIGDVNVSQYEAIYLAGGHGAMFDFRQSADLRRIVEEFYATRKVISGVCHGIAGLLDVTDEKGVQILRGKRVTGFSHFEDTLAGVINFFPFSLEVELKNVGALYRKNLIPFTNRVEIETGLITGQNPASAKSVGREVVRMLQNV